jgi:hypothetical protein
MSRSVTVAVGVVVTARVHDPAQEDCEQDEGYESADQRPVHGRKHIRGRSDGAPAIKRGAPVFKRGARPARWATGTPKPPACAAPAGTRSGAGSAAAGHQDAPDGRSDRGRPDRSRTEDSDGRSSFRSLPSPLPRDHSPYLTPHPVRELTQPTAVPIKADSAPLAQRRFPEIAGTSAQSKYLQTARCSYHGESRPRIFRSFVTPCPSLIYSA